MVKQQPHRTKKTFIAPFLLWLNATTAHARVGTSLALVSSKSNYCCPHASKIKLESTTSEPIQMFQVIAISSGTDVAKNKAATQSSTYKTRYAPFAVDGNSTTFSHTGENDDNPWWQVDLGGYYNTESVFIKNRWCGDLNDATECLCRLSGARLSLLDGMDGVVYSSTLPDTCGVHNIGLDLWSGDCGPIGDSCYPDGRTVRIESNTGLSIAMFEVQVVSLMDENLALGKTATQSSTWKTRDASFATDGDASTFSHTGGDDTNPFWQVDLGTTSRLKSVEISNRWCVDDTDPNGCLCKMSGATVAVLNEAGEAVATRVLGDTCGVRDVSVDLYSCTGVVTTAPSVGTTSAPSASPSVVMTPSPSPSPTSNPTSKPTPSTVTTTAPSASPSVAMTPSPTPKPTSNPTPSTTSSPTVNGGSNGGDGSNGCGSCYPEASRLKIESTTGEPIQMFEVQLLSSGVNFALGQAATQSSTWKTRDASFAVDGYDTTFSHTGANDESPSWELEFDGTYLVEFVKIKNRWCIDESDINECLCRLSDARLSLMNDLGEVVSSKTLGNTCGLHYLDLDLSTCTDDEPVPSITYSEGVVVSDESFGITLFNPIDNTQIHAAVVATDSLCTEENSSLEIGPGYANVFSGYGQLDLFQNLGELITAEDRNNGSVTLNLCLRADVTADGFSSSLISKKLSIEITLIFDESGSDFELELSTAEFNHESLQYTSARVVDFTVGLGTCLAPSDDGPYELGSTLKFYVKSSDSDVIISGLTDVSFTDMNGGPILGIVDSIGVPSFVTSIAGLNSKYVDVATMMITTVYDQYAGQTINVNGNVQVTYIDVDESASPQSRRLERIEKSPFAVKVVVGERVEAEQQGAAKSDSAIKGILGAVAGTAFVAGIVFLSSLI